MADILLGPILGYEWDDEEKQGFYTVIVRLAKVSSAPQWVVDDQSVTMCPLGEELHDGSCVWRGEVALRTLQDGEYAVSYSIQCNATRLHNICNDSEWSFYLPGHQQPRIAFCSCNGFTESATLNDGCEPLHLWERMQDLHRASPFSLLIMGGDQLYCDSVAKQKQGLARFWAQLSSKERAKLKPNPKQLRKDYFEHYRQCWVAYKDHKGRQKCPHTAMIKMMACVPSIMMWDDHDIFDGYGSYQANPEKMPYHVEAYEAAKEAFEIYQIRGAYHNRSLLERGKTSVKHYSQGLQFGVFFHILMLDNRSCRTPKRIMDELQWKQVTEWLEKNAIDKEAAKKTLLVVSPIPVVYRRFYDWLSDTPGEHGSEDDLRDHWNHHNHQGERDRLVSHLFKALCFKDKPCGHSSGFARVTLLSGDVHVGALGFLERTDAPAKIAQVISSAIVHPAPGRMAWAGVCAISSDADYYFQDQAVVAKMASASRYMDEGKGENKYLRCRNFAWLKNGTDGKLWVNWECEDDKYGLAERGLP